MSDDEAVPTQEADRRKKIAQDIFGDSESEEEADYVPEDIQPKKKKKKDKKEKTKSKSQEKTDKKEKGTFDSDDDAPAPRNAEDDGFIDDRGAKAARYDDDSEGSDPGEAMEDNTPEDELDAMLEKAKPGRRGKHKLNQAEISAGVERFLAKMELAADTDVDLNHRGKPAIHKLTMLGEVVKVLEKRTLHEALLEQGLLNLLKQWLEPLPDGSLANLNLRSTLLRLIVGLPIDVELFERREQLKKSGLGKVVMFLYKLPEETLPNKRMAQGLVEKWSRPIFELSQSYGDLRRMNDVSAPNEDEEEDQDEDQDRKKKRKAASLGDADVMAKEEQDGPKAGEPGYRWHAAVPQPVKMDYKIRPESLARAEKVAARGKKDEIALKRERLGKSIQRLKLKNKKRDVHALSVSIEGRGVDRTL
mmetsp:Transcript_3925/g.4407  ORF Transcript_3925/g.4407 Transcript_3925/m.4407 type:complete len:418 (+) Transcript_3925:288-1541(+)|eukprot:CAMPEP_0197844212 /NCGR_PEP_ID=MMETSP1438-20131217/1201_1 /TAXON_ID=1461541 /ORGANISM="Pterosperma sp., Strain CCMP1384" /LENGTH=417 /DNA_ID=CAMNT_0043454877 /DNA_START=284 /DNA_END=1537 /DNA_ORIENTATION=+